MLALTVHFNFLMTKLMEMFLTQELKCRAPTRGLCTPGAMQIALYGNGVEERGDTNGRVLKASRLGSIGKIKTFARE